MTIPLLVVGVVALLVTCLIVYRRSVAGLPADGFAPADGLHPCRACRGCGAVSDPSTKSGYGMCVGCSGTGWTRD